MAGAEFEVPVLRAAAGLDEEDVLSALEEASAARIVLEAGTRYRFAHALVRHTLNDGLSAARRPTVHRRVAQAIEAVHAGRLDDHLPALAHHYARASAVPDTATAVSYAVQAGDRALAQLAHDEAAAYYRQALELSDLAGAPATTAGRVDLLLALGEAQRRAGDTGHRQTLLQAAELAKNLGDAGRLARAALTNSRGAWTYTMGVDTDKVAALEAALDAIPPGDSAMRARLLANLGQELVFAGRGNDHLDLSVEALAMARRVDDKPTLAHVLSARCVVQFSNPALLDEWLANTAELLAVAEAGGDPSRIAYACHLRFTATFQAGLVEEADRALEGVRQAAEEAGQPILRWWPVLDRAGRVLAAGRMAEAVALNAEALELGLAAGQPDARQFHASLRYEWLYDLGRLDEDVDRLVVAVQNSDRPILRAMLALASSETGAHHEARRLLRGLVPALPRLPMVGPWFRTVVPAAAACVRIGEAALAGPLFDLLRPYAGIIAGTTVGWSGSTSHYLGMLATVLGRFDEAERHFSAAGATHTRIDAPVWLARTRTEWARMLLAPRHPGDAERAGALLGQALTTARELGLAQVERDTVALLG